MQTIIIAIAFFVIANSLSARSVQAGPPGGEATSTPEPTPTATPAELLFHVPLSNEEPLISWPSVAGAVAYRLTGTLLVGRVNAADPFCQRPLVSDQRTITVDETLDSEITQFQLPLPPLPPEDTWFFFQTDVKLVALDGDGAVIAGGAIGGIADGALAQCPTPTAMPRLPATGTGAIHSTDGQRDLLAAVFAAGAVSLGLLAIAGRVLVARRR